MPIGKHLILKRRDKSYVNADLFENYIRTSYFIRTEVQSEHIWNFCFILSLSTYVIHKFENSIWEVQNDEFSNLWKVTIIPSQFWIQLGRSVEILPTPDCWRKWGEMCSNWDFNKAKRNETRSHKSVQLPGRFVWHVHIISKKDLVRVWREIWFLLLMRWDQVNRLRKWRMGQYPVTWQNFMIYRLRFLSIMFFRLKFIVTIFVSQDWWRYRHISVQSDPQFWINSQIPSTNFILISRQFWSFLSFHSQPLYCSSSVLFSEFRSLSFSCWFSAPHEFASVRLRHSKTGKSGPTQVTDSHTPIWPSPTKPKLIKFSEKV
jgi:hypothetical protein